ncbi:MAG: NTP transferase domain-containing protein [Lachnospiraceae bacterium]|nr:NTP transferase domain-containing protein [Lachnospiraceae bacterium]
MRALILNSGMGSRMGEETETHPKCMTRLKGEETILSRQLNILQANDIKDVVITTGYFKEVLEDYCDSLQLDLKITFVNNIDFQSTNYIYSIYLAKEFLIDDLILMHGDLVYEEEILREMIQRKDSLMAVSSTIALPEKDFKAVIEKGKIKKVGIEFFHNVYAAQPLYVLQKEDWIFWLNEIDSFCKNGDTKCYAENALNEISGKMILRPFDVKNRLCSEIDTMDDWNKIITQLN